MVISMFDNPMAHTVESALFSLRSNRKREIVRNVVPELALV